MTRMQYLFGDTDIAAHRLEVLAQVFAESTRSFVLDAAVENPGLVLDLGCGPGCTTHFLAELLGCRRIVGLDNSEHFVSVARKTETPTVSFRLHDVTSVPFPVGPSDLIYCRFLLTHLREPGPTVEKWATQLRPRGLLLIEEVESIETDNAAFTAYLGIVEAMLRHNSQELYVGPLVDSLDDSHALKKRISRVTRLRVPNDRAATMFFLNMQSWKARPFVRKNYTQAAISALEADLRDLMQQPGGDSRIEWGLRQAAFERKE